MTMFSKLIAIKDGGSNPSAPNSSDDLSLSLGTLASELSSFDLTASNNSLVAFDAASLDFGNAAANPAFNFLGTGAFAVAGDSHFSATGGSAGSPDFLVDGFAKFAGQALVGGDLSVGGDLTVTGASTLTGSVTASSDLVVMGSAAIAGNLTVNGTLVTRDRESVLVADNFLDMNSGYITTNAPLASGFTFNYNPIDSWSVTALGATTITVSGSPGVTAGDFVMLTNLDPALAADEGIYEVASVAGGVITISAAPSYPWCKNTIAGATQNPGQGAKVASINLAVLQTSEAGALQWGAASSANDISLNDVPFNGYSGSQSWTGKFTLAGDLTIHNGVNESHALSLNEVAADPQAPQGTGKVYTKSMTTNNVAISELFYTSEIGGVYTPVQITKNGGLNIGALTFALQDAYEDGNTIAINDNNRPVSINVGNYSGNALQVVGPSSLGATAITSTLDVQGAVTFLSALDARGAASFGANISVMGSAIVHGGVGIYDSNLTIKSVNTNTFTVEAATGNVMAAGTLNVSGAATLGSTLGVTGAATLSSSLHAVGAVQFDSSLDVSGAATLMSTLDVSGNITASADVQVAGLLDLNGSLDANVTSFNVLSTGGIDLYASGSILKLHGEKVAANLAVDASANIDPGTVVTMTANGLAAAQANAQDVIALGVAIDTVAANATCDGKVQEFGAVKQVTVESGINNISAGNRLYLSAADAGAVTNVIPTGTNKTVFQIGLALGTINNGKVTVALRPQFLYNL